MVWFLDGRVGVGMLALSLWRWPASPAYFRWLPHRLIRTPSNQSVTSTAMGTTAVALPS